MSELLTPHKTERGWVVAMTPEMAREAGVSEGSYLLFYLNAGHVSAEILPPPTDAMRRSVRESMDKFRDAFAEMKRLGD
jgi:hypothetical protein